MKPEGMDVQLGDHEYRVRPQRHAYLKRQLRAFVESLQQLEDMEVEDLLDIFTAKAYDGLAVFIPDVMPRHEFEGYDSPEAMEQDTYDKERDRSPTAPQIKAAFTAAMTVNDFDWLGQLKNFIGPDLIRAQIRTGMAAWAAERAQKAAALTTTGSSKTPANSPPENGASSPESSGTIDPTSAPPPQPTSA